jgi:hypothetical protein
MLKNGGIGAFPEYYLNDYAWETIIISYKTFQFLKSLSHKVNVYHLNSVAPDIIALVLKRTRVRLITKTFEENLDNLDDLNEETMMKSL